MVYLGIDGEVVETTPEHPFYTTESDTLSLLSSRRWAVADGVS